MSMVLTTPRKGTPTMNNIVVGSGAAVQLIKPNRNRISVMFQNQGTVNVFLGTSTVTASGTTTGYLLAPGTIFTDNATNVDWWGIAASASANVTVMEVC